MCLAVPARVIRLEPDDRATVEVAGVETPVDVSLVAPVAVGDYLVIHVGYALTRLDPAEAAHTLALLTEVARARELPA